MKNFETFHNHLDISNDMSKKVYLSVIFVLAMFSTV